MTTPVSPIILLDAVRREKEKRAAEKSLMEFVRQAWHIVEPGTPFIDGWHLHAIAMHLEAVIEGEISRLIITMPPRHAKSLIVAVFFPVWVWLTRPQFRWMFASYAGSLSVRDSLKCRRIIQSEWFQARWGSVFQLTGDQSGKMMFENNKTGYRFATSVGASTTGHGGDCVVVDDPLNSKDAQSDAVRKAALDWFDMSASTRLNDPKTGAFIIVQQRLHEADLAGHLLKQGGWEHLDLPAEYDGKRNKTTLGWEDPRSKMGSLLWPERFGAKEIAFLKKQLGSYGAAGQLQQRPAPEGGGILKTSHFQLWPKDRPLPVFDLVVQSYDTAFSGEDAKQNAQTAHQTWGLAEYKGKRIGLLLDSWADHLAYPELRARVLRDWKTVYGTSPDDKSRKGRRPDNILVEKKASGHSLLQDLRAANVPAVAYSPTSDKVARAHQAAPILELDCLYIPESAKEPGTFVTWARPLVEQCEKFPNSELKDNVDAFTQFVIWARDANYFDLDFVEAEVPEEVDYHAQKKRRINPYSQ